MISVWGVIPLLLRGSKKFIPWYSSTTIATKTTKTSPTTAGKKRRFSACLLSWFCWVYSPLLNNHTALLSHAKRAFVISLFSKTNFLFRWGEVHCLYCSRVSSRICSSCIFAGTASSHRTKGCGRRRSGGGRTFKKRFFSENISLGKCWYFSTSSVCIWRRRSWRCSGTWLWICPSLPV